MKTRFFTCCCLFLIIGFFQNGCTPDEPTKIKEKTDTETIAPANTDKTSEITSVSTDRTQYDGDYFIVFRSSDANDAGEQRIYAATEFKITNSEFSGTIRNILGESFNVKGSINSNGNVDFETVTLSNNRDVSVELKGKFEGKTLKIDYKIGSRQGTAEGFLYKELTGPSEYDGKYKLTFLVGADLKAVSDVRIEKGVIAGTLSHQTGETFDLKGRILPDGKLYFNTLTGKSGSLLTGEAIATSGGLSGKYYKGGSSKENGTLEARREGELRLSSVPLQIGVIDKSDRQLAIIAAETNDESSKRHALVIYRQKPKNKDDKDDILNSIELRRYGFDPAEIFIGGLNRPNLIKIANYEYRIPDTSYTGAEARLEITAPDKRTFQTTIQVKLPDTPLNFAKGIEPTFANNRPSGATQRLAWLRSAASIISQIACGIIKNTEIPEKEKIWPVMSIGCASNMLTVLGNATVSELDGMDKEFNAENEPILDDFNVSSKQAPQKPKVTSHLTVETNSANGETYYVTDETKIQLDISASDNVGVKYYFAAEKPGDRPEKEEVNGSGQTNPDKWFLAEDDDEDDDELTYNEEIDFTFITETEVGVYFKTIYVWFMDAVKEISDEVSVKIKQIVADKNGPTSVHVTIKSQDGSEIVTHSRDVVLKLTAKDDEKVTAYCVFESGSPCNFESVPTQSSSITFETVFRLSAINPSDGNAPPSGCTGICRLKQVQVKFKDAAGNISTANDSILLDLRDAEAPTSPVVVVFSNFESANINSQNPTGDASTHSNLVTLKISGRDNVGVQSVFVSEASTKPAPGVAASCDGQNSRFVKNIWCLIPSSPVLLRNDSVEFESTTVPGEYRKRIYVWLQDEAGNISETVSDDILLIVEQLTIPQNVTLAIQDGGATVVGTDIVARVSADDDQGLVAYYLSETESNPRADDSGWISIAETTHFEANVPYTVTTSAVTGTFSKKVFLWFKNKVGQMAGPVNDTVSIRIEDTQSPTDPKIEIRPTQSILLSGDRTDSTLVQLKLSAHDNSAVTGYFVSEDSKDPLASANGWIPVNPNRTYSQTVGFTLEAPRTTGDQSRTVYVWFKDAFSNVSLRNSDSVTLSVKDFQGPCQSQVVINSGAVTTLSTGVTLAISARDDVRVAAYFVSESFNTPAANNPEWKTVTSSSSSPLESVVCPNSQRSDITQTSRFSQSVAFNLTGGGNKTGKYARVVYVWFRDEAGNISDPASDQITLEVEDTEKPTVPKVKIKPRKIDGFRFDTTVSTLVDLTLSAKDNKGVVAYFASTRNRTPSDKDSNWVNVPENKNYSETVPFLLDSRSESGEYTVNVFVWFKDDAGNVTDTVTDKTIYVVTDTAKPTGGLITLGDGLSSTESRTVSVSIAARDDVGVTAYFLSEDRADPVARDSGWKSVAEAKSFSQAGISFTLRNSSLVGRVTRTVYVWFKDDAGNISDAVSDSISLVVKDVLAPTGVSVSIQGEDGSTGETDQLLVFLNLRARDDHEVYAYFASEDTSIGSVDTVDWVWIKNPSASYSAKVPFVMEDITTEGEHVKAISVWFRDESGNISFQSSDQITFLVDNDDDTRRDAPQNPFLKINNGALSTKERTVQVVIRAHDDDLESYLISDKSVTPSENSSDWKSSETLKNSGTLTLPITLAPETDVGEYSRFLFVWFKDADGNISQVASDSITLEIEDLEKPSQVSASIRSTSGSTSITTSALVRLALAAKDDTGVTAYLVLESTTTPVNPSKEDPRWVFIPETDDFSQAVSFALTPENLVGDYVKTLHIWFRDDAGNISDRISSSITLKVEDINAPVPVSMEINPNSVLEEGVKKTHSTAVTLSLSATDNDGIVAYCASEDEDKSDHCDWILINNGKHKEFRNNVSFILEPESVSETTKTVFAWFKDDAGNISEAISSQIILVVDDDKKPNKITLKVTGENGAASTSSTVVQTEIHAEDDVGVVAYYLSESSEIPSPSDSNWILVEKIKVFSTKVSFALTPSADAGSFSRTIFVHVRDDAGNVSEAVGSSITVLIQDIEKPKNTLLEIDATTTRSTDISLHLKAFDNTGVTGYFVSENLITPSANDLGWKLVTAIQNFDRTVSFQLNSEEESGDYNKTVFAWFRDASGNVSNPVSDSILLRLEFPAGMVLIKGGFFSMGSNQGKPNEAKPHGVTISQSFFMSEHEVTAAEYKRCVDDNKCDYGADPRDDRANFRKTGRENYPMNFISWDQSQKYLDWLDLQFSNVHVRFCTEAEWEYAARAGTLTKWSCGSDESCLSDVAWYDRTALDRNTHPVKQKNPNAFDLYDMHGNVWEWVADYLSSGYATSNEIDPEGATTGQNRVVRGGSFAFGADEQRSSFRAGFIPTTRDADIGLRACASQ